MANKQQVYDAFYEGACTVLMSLIGNTGINFNDLDLDKEELREYAERKGFDEIAAQLKSED